MLYVKELVNVFEDGSSVVINDYRSGTPWDSDYDYRTRVVLEETATGEQYEFMFDTLGDVHDEFVKLSPYGYADRVGEKIADFNELLSIDALSLKFLDFVSNVREEESDDRVYLTDDYAFESLDSLNSLFLCSIESDNLSCACTLLQVICYSAEIIDGNKAVFYGIKWFTDYEADEMTEDEKDEYNPVRKYTVEFSDVQSAMRLIAKYRIAGSNPLKTVFGEYTSLYQ